jgi:hypothetical protein
MNYHITVRHGAQTQRYLTISVSAGDAAEALVLASKEIPAEVVAEVDLVELRVAPDFDKRFPEDLASEAPTQAGDAPAGGIGEPPSE